MQWIILQMGQIVPTAKNYLAQESNRAKRSPAINPQKRDYYVSTCFISKGENTVYRKVASCPYLPSKIFFGVQMGGVCRREAESSAELKCEIPPSCTRYFGSQWRPPAWLLSEKTPTFLTSFCLHLQWILDNRQLIFLLIFLYGSLLFDTILFWCLKIANTLPYSQQRINHN